MSTPRVLKLSDGHGLSIAITDIGATWLSCIVPLAGGGEREVLLGHARPEDHLTEPGYLGGIVGRYANRIAGARFELDGRLHELSANDGPNCLHGGADGFNRRRFDVVDEGRHRATLRLLSPAGDQGFPGDAEVFVSYELRIPGCVRIEWRATVTEACPISLSSHAYFSLDGAGQTILDQTLQLRAKQWLPIDAGLIPTGTIEDVDDTPFDFRAPQRIGARLNEGEQQRLAGGYDHCWLLDRSYGPAAVLTSADRAVTMSLHTSSPSLQFYSGQHLARTRDRQGQFYVAHAGLALEPQFPPDAPNRPRTLAGSPPSWILKPGDHLQHYIEYRFVA